MSEYNQRVNGTTIKALTAITIGIDPKTLVAEDLQAAGDDAAAYLLDLYAKTLTIAHGALSALAAAHNIETAALIQQLATKGAQND